MIECVMDRRVIRTRKALKKGLLKLMQQKRIQEITVRELTELCDLNRCTFYCHYKDVFEMIDQIESEFIESFRELLNSFDPQDVFINPQAFFMKLFGLIEGNREIVLICFKGDPRFVDRIKELLYERFADAWPSHFTNAREQDYLYYASFVAFGLAGLMEAWLSQGMEDSQDHMVELAAQLALNNPAIRNLKTS